MPGDGSGTGVPRAAPTSPPCTMVNAMHPRCLSSQIIPLVSPGHEVTPALHHVPNPEPQGTPGGRKPTGGIRMGAGDCPGDVYCSSPVPIASPRGPDLTWARGGGGGDGAAAVWFLQGRGGQNHSTSLR